MEENKKQSKGLIITMVVFVIIAIVVAIVLCFAMRDNKKVDEKISEHQITPEEESEESIKESDDLEVVPTMDDTVYTDTAWCPTFQLVWNDMIDDVVKKDVEFIDGDEPDYLENLNNEIFKEEDISHVIFTMTDDLNQMN